MTDTMLLAEKLKTILELENAARCVVSLTNALPRCENEDERLRVATGIDHFKADVQRYGDRLLQLAVSDSAARVA